MRNKDICFQFRDVDPTQKEDSVSVGQIYRDKFGKDRGAIK